MALTRKGEASGKGGDKVNLKISATDEASSQIKSIEGSLAALKNQIRSVSQEVVTLGKTVATTTATGAKQIAGLTAATAGGAIALSNSGTGEALKQAFAGLDQQIFSQRAKIGEIGTAGGQLAKPLLEGVFFGASESNTKRIIAEKSKNLAYDVIEAIDLGKILGDQGAKFGEAGRKLGGALGGGLEFFLKDRVAGRFGQPIIAAFQQISKLTDTISPKIKQVATLLGTIPVQSAAVQQGLRFQREDLEFQSKILEREGSVGQVRDILGRQGGLEEVRESERLFSGSEFDRRTAMFRTPEFRQSVVRRIGNFAQGLVGGPSEQELRRQEAILQAEKARIQTQSGLQRLFRRGQAEPDERVGNLDEALRKIEGQRSRNTEARESVASLVEAISEELYDLAFESLGDAFENNPRVRAAVTDFTDRINRAAREPSGFAQGLVLEAKFLALELEQVIRNLPKEATKALATLQEGVRSAFDSLAQSTEKVDRSLGRSFRSIPQAAGQAISFVADRIDDLAAEIVRASSRAAAALGDFVRGVGGATQGLGGRILADFQKLSPIVDSLAVSLSRAFKGISPALSQFILERASDFRFLGLEASEAVSLIGEAIALSGDRLEQLARKAGVSLGTSVSGIGTEVRFAGIDAEQSLAKLGRVGNKVFREMKTEAKFVLLELQNTSAYKKAEGLLSNLFKDVPERARRGLAQARNEIAEIGAGISERVRERLDLNGTLRENLANLANRSGVKEAGANIGLRIGTAIADGLSSAARTYIGRELDRIDRRINAVAQNVPRVMGAISQGLSKGAEGVGIVSGLREPAQIFGFLKEQAGRASQAISLVSQEISFFAYAIQELQTFVIGGPYEILIGQNVRLQEQLLATKASIVANNKVLAEGVKIDDPAKAIQALNAPIEAAISKIRKDSLELVGVTSKELIEVFNIVSQQISNVNLDLNEAADLTIAFAAGLGTIGLPLNQAQQEIQSILTGTVDMNSVLAKSLGITNAQLKTWIAQDIVYERLNQRLAAFVEGNSLAAKTVNGIRSNIQEIADEIGRSAGAQFLEPIVDQMQIVYEFLSQNQELLVNLATEKLAELADAIGRVGVSAGGVGQDILPILSNAIRILWETMINVIDAAATGIGQLRKILAPFVPILQEIGGLVKAASGPFLQLAISMKVLSAGISGVQVLMGSLLGAIPILGESLFLLEIRNAQVVNTFASLANPRTGIGAAAASFLLLGRSMNSIPGVAALVGARLQAAFGPFSGLVAAAIPTVSTFTLRLLALGQQIEPLGRILKGVSLQIPGLITGFTGFLSSTKIAGVALSEFTPSLVSLSDEIQGIVASGGDLGDVLSKRLTNLLQEQGRLARNTAIRYGLWGAAIVGIAGSISLLLIKNDALRVVLEGLFNIIKKIAVAIVDLLMEPLTQVLILVTSLTAAIATGLATQVARMTIEFAKFAATQAPATLKLMVDNLRAMITLLRATEISSISRLFAGVGQAYAPPSTFGELELAGEPRREVNMAVTSEAAPARNFGQVYVEPPESFGEVELNEEPRKPGEPPSTFGEVDIESEAQESEREKRERERERKLEEQERRKERRAKTRSRLEGKVAPERIEELLDLSEAQAEVAKTSGQFEQGMIGSRQATTASSKSTATAARSTTALGNAQAFATKTAATLGATMKALVVTLGPIVGIVALFSAWGYAIGQVTKASQIQKEMQEELLKVLKEQEVTIAKIQSLQGKQVENPLLEQITESDLKTDEERRAFKEGGAEQVLALRRARDLNDEGKEKSPIRRFGEAALNFSSRVTTSALYGIPGKLAELAPNDRFAQRIADIAQNATESTTSSRRVAAERIAGTETLTDAGTFLQQSQSTTRASISGLMKQAQETEKLLTEARAKGLEARSRELEEKLDQEQEAYKKAQDEILDYATALEGTKFATSAQQEDALGIATALRKVVSDLEEEITVTGVDFARLGTSFEQLRVESENALAFFRKGEGNPEQVKQRAGQLLSSTQQLFEDSFISSEQALANYAVLLQRNSALELDDQKKLQEAILAARQKQVDGAVKLEEAKVARLKQLAAEGDVGQFESELGNLELERQKAEIQLKGLRTSYEEQNRLRVARFQDAAGSIGGELSKSQKELAANTGSSEATIALRTEISGYQEQLADLGESFRNQQRSANRNFVTEEADLIAQIAESQNQELELRLKELQDRANSALDESMAKRKAQLQELRNLGIVSEEQQNLAVAKLQEDRVQQDLALERRRLREYMANPRRFEREIRESNKRIAQLTLERFEAERNSWERQLALFQRYVDDQAEAAKNAIEIENQELIKQSKLYEAISQAISARNELLGKAKDFTQATGSAVADTLERIAKLTGNEVLQADLATSAAIIRRDTLAKQLEIQSKIFEIEQKQAEIALIRREAENAIALAKAKQQILSAQGAVVVAEEQFKRGDITEAELTGKRLELLGAVTDYQGLELERNVIAQERQLQPVLQELLRQQQQQEAQAQLDAADIAVLETFPQGLSAEADVDMAIRLGDRLGIKATDMKDLAEQIRGVRGELQSGYAQEIYGDPNIFADDIGVREAQMQAGPGYRNIERLKAQGIDLGFYSELEKITASPIASVPVVEDGERFLDRGTSGRASAGAFDEQTGPLLDILSGVETATAGMDESIAGLEESFSSVSLENLQSVLPEIVGRDAIIDATFEGSGKVEAAINEGLALSNETLETITDGLEPLAEVRDFLGEDGPLKMSLDNLNLEPYLGENAELLRTTTSIASGVEAIVAALPGAIAPEAAPAAEAAAEESTQPKQDDPPLRQREINSFIRQFETLISKEALEKARSKESESGRRVTETELRDLIASSISPFRLEGSKLNLETASTGQILEAFRTAVTDAQTETTGRGGRGGRTRTTYEIKPNLTFNVQGNPDERTIAREAVRQFETILNRAIAQG